MFNLYTIGTFLALLIWFFFFILQDNKQKVRVLKYSLLMSAFGPFSQIWFLRNYWTVDQFQLSYLARTATDLVFAFTLAGVGAVALDTILKKRWDLSTNFRITPTILFPYLLFGIWMFIFTNLSDINSIYSSSAYLALIGLVLGYRKKILRWALLNGVFAAISSLGLYFVFQQFYPDLIKSLNILLVENNLFFLGIPMTEMLVYFATGIAAYTHFKLVFGYKSARAVHKRTSRKA